MSPSPEATLAISSSCPHCPAMLEVLTQLVKQGKLAELHIINLTSHSSFATEHQIRSVPWLKLGPLVLQGAHSPHEIQTWLERSQSESGIDNYFTELLTQGELTSVSHAVQLSPELLQRLIPLISSDETNINVRLGLAAILEELAGQPVLENLLDDLKHLLQHEQARVRGDAAHFLSFVHSPEALSILCQAQGDQDAEVREIIEESIETLQEANLPAQP